MRWGLVVLFSINLLLVYPAWARDGSDPYWEYRDEAERGEFDYDDSLDAPWRESGLELPPLPADASLRAIPLDELQEGLTAYTHLPSLTIGKKDLVTRYWLIIKGRGGGYNATFEALRCATGEYKIYAYGNPRREPQVKAAPNAQWRNLVVDVASYRRELARDVFCIDVTAKPKRQIDAALRGEHATENPYAHILD